MFENITNAALLLFTSNGQAVMTGQTDGLMRVSWLRRIFSDISETGEHWCYNSLRSKSNVLSDPEVFNPSPGGPPSWLSLQTQKIWIHRLMKVGESQDCGGPGAELINSWPTLRSDCSGWAPLMVLSESEVMRKLCVYITLSLYFSGGNHYYRDTSVTWCFKWAFKDTSRDWKVNCHANGSSSLQ